MPRGTSIAKNIPTEELIDMYWNKGMSIREITHHFGYSHPEKNTALHQLFDRRGISKRNTSEMMHLRYQKSPETFFVNKPKGENHHKWKGGRRKNNGYIHILKPNHPKADKLGYILEHRYVWEEAHGSPIPKGWVIHHLNGIRHDNRPQNLVAVPKCKHEHHTFVKTLQARIRELEQLHLSI